MSVIEKDVQEVKSGWRSFTKGKWSRKVDVNNFIASNIKPYEGNEEFLVGPTSNTTELWKIISQLSKEERERGGVWDVSLDTVSTITSHAPGYIDKDKEQIVGVQTDAPFKRSIQPFGGIKMMVDATKAYGFELPQNIVDMFTNIRKTHNQGVFDAYTPDMRAVRKSGVITGLPDAYGRGRIIGDYRRIALYGIDFLIKDKKQQQTELEVDSMTEDIIRLREELSEQIRALGELKEMAYRSWYGYFQTSDQLQRSYSMGILRVSGSS